MKQKITLLFFALLAIFSMSAQNIVKGVVNDRNSEGFLQGVSVSVQGANINQTTGVDGVFVLNNVPNGKQLVVIKKNGYETQSFPVNMSGKEIDLGTIFMYEDEFAEEQDQSVIIITDDELSDDASSADNISGLLQSSRDVYLRTAAFEWSPSFYRIRGLDSENGKVLINGVEMNKLYNGRPQWSNWGGLNDVLRNQEFSNGFSPSNYAFGGVLGSTNINTRASEYREGGRIAYSSSNRSYVHRLMASYSSGLLENGWAFTVAASRRDGKEGFVDGTSYNANSIMASVEKKINDSHSINFTSIYAQNKRGKSAPNSQQVYDIKGIKYNPYWGYQNGKIRNSRIKRVEEPIVMLNHYWTMSENTTLNTNIAYQFGEIGNSRLDFNGGNDPDPTYYRKLPNWHLNDPRGADYTNAYKALTHFQNNGQLNWTDLYAANENEGDNARYVQYEDRNDDKQLTVNTILNTDLTDNISLNGSLEYRKLNSENFANVLDLLGATGYVDINKFGDPSKENYQNDLLNPNRVVRVGDRFKYNYNLESEIYGGFAQLQFKYKKVDFYVAGSAHNTTHQREGLYQNGGFSTNSLGRSKKLDFFNYGAKAGLTYKISGRHLLDFNGGYITKAPSIRNSFINSRANNLTLADVSTLDSEKIMSFDGSYIIRSPFVKSKLTGYYTSIEDATDIAFFYNDGNGLFVQEATTGINKKHFGAELGIEVKITPTFTLKGAANIGQYTYDNNPNVTQATEPNERLKRIRGFDERGIRNFDKASLKNYKVASGPQNAYSFGFEYRDPDYWFVSVTGNYFDNTYIDVAPIKRTSFFVSDDGQPFPGYDPALAREFLNQEKFDPYFTLNAIGGKTWKVGNQKYIGVFASVSNILNQEYKTGGYEYSRSSNFQSIKADRTNGTPNFGDRYWYGRGTTYFVNVNYRF